MNKIEIIDFFSKNYSCRKCFNNPNITKSGKPFGVADISGPQPRWLGRNYFSSEKKICIMLINPGSGNKTPENEWAPLKKLNKAETQELKEKFWDQLMYTNEVGMPKWGAWVNLYFESLGLVEKKDEVAFMNMMLCASKGNAYNKKSLDLCFSSQSSHVLRMLSPDILIFSGAQTISNSLKKPIAMSKLRDKGGEHSREIDPSLVKKEIRECLHRNSKYFFIGHYAARYSTGDFDKAMNDASIVSKSIKN
jgi:hypothetical protein